MKKTLLKMGLLINMVSLECFAVEESKDIYTHECTSWLLFSELTQNNTHILHKNRDAPSRNLMALKSKQDSPRKWIGLGDGNIKNPDVEFVCMGLNASGLAAVVNSGEASVEHSDPKATMGTPAIVKKCLTECDTSAQAVEKLKDVLRSGQYSHGRAGSIFFFMDTKEAYIVEMTAQRTSVMRYDHGYAFRANIWHNPDMAAAANSPIHLWLNSCNREYMVIRDLNKTWRTHKKITVADMLEMSRDIETPKDSPITRTLCSKSTNSASTLEINLSYPDVLSTGYFLIGPPRHTICVPVPVCVEKYHPYMTTLRWSSAAWKSFDKNGFDAEVPAAWKDFESRSLVNYKKVQAKAEELLKNGKHEDAVRLLNNTAYSIWEEAAKLIQP